MQSRLGSYFGSVAPEDKESNWLQTVPGKSRRTILRLYNPLHSLFDKSWRPSEIEAVSERATAVRSRPAQ